MPGSIGASGATGLQAAAGEARRGRWGSARPRLAPRGAGGARAPPKGYAGCLGGSRTQLSFPWLNFKHSY